MAEYVKVKVYEIHELSEEAQKNAYHQWLCGYGHGYPWWDEAERSMKEFANVFGIEIKDYCIDPHRGSYIEWDYRGDEENLERRGSELARWLEEEYGSWLQQDCPFTGYCADEDLLEPIREFLKDPRESITFEGLLYDAFAGFANAVAEDMIHCWSFEYFLEECDANCWRFTEDGTIWTFGGKIVAADE